ncbi:PQQ-like beta-propeller repeat protein [Halorarius litoreus]|uniref:PQQ-like beta-propeller repeat protein n=1 Tax=Halorarius litoreus TaxID=2962676 RepID=UPI0020CF7434|nr:PQQ-like beta-propeller repeat protein [Halorarius litoreus]
MSLPSRRAFLATTGSIAAVAAAGCTSLVDAPGDAEPTLTPPAENPIESVAGSAPQYRVDARNAGVTSDGPDDEPRLAWVHERDEAAGPLCTLADGTLFVGDDAGTVAALDAATGEQAWRYDLGGTVRSAPAVHAGRVVVGTHRGDYSYDGEYAVVALDAETGEQAWRGTLRESASVASPTLTDDLALVPTGGGGIRAFGLADGAERWRVPASPGTWTTPAVVDGIAYCGERAVEATTGDVVRDGPTRNAPTAVVDGVVYAGGASMGAFDADTGQERWRVDPPADYYVVGSPVVTADTVFAPVHEEVSDASGDDSLLALDRSDGTVQWRTALPSFVPQWAPFTVAGGAVYVGGAGLRALDADSGEERWSVASEFSFGQPLAADGVLFATAGRYVCAFA